MAVLDEDLINLYNNGDENALKTLIERYTSHIYNFTRRFCGDNAEDITQDVFIKVWKNIRKFDSSKSSFKTWLFTIARNTAFDFLRKKKSITFSDLETGLDGEYFSNTIVDESLMPDEVLQKFQDVEFLNNLLSKLPIQYQAVLTLYYQEEMTFSEVGNILGKPLNTVKSHHRRALELLRKMAI